MVRHALADFESLEALFVVRRRQALPADAVVAASRGNIAAHFFDMMQYRQLVAWRAA
jgi:hypothetical protein